MAGHSTKVWDRPGKGLCLLSLLAVLSSAGCHAIPNTGPTAVSRAELYESSEPEYDAFFQLLHDVQRKTTATGEEQRTLARSLAAELGLDEFASMKLVAERFDKTLEELTKRESKLTIEFIGLEEGANETDAVVTLTDAAGAPKDSSLTKTLSQVARRLAKLVVALRATRRSIEKLNTKLPVLEQRVDERFRLLGPARTKETKRNLADAHVALQSLRVQLEASEEKSGALMEVLSKAGPAAEEDKPADGANPKTPGKPKPKAR